MVIFAASYICRFIFLAAFPFSRSGGWHATGRWNNAKGGMRYAFPPYGLLCFR
jgi:hypothetical protein